MANLIGTKTEENLKAAFAGESQARGKYFYFAAKAKEEGHAAVAHYFEETAVNEQEHAKIWFNLLNGIGTTKENIQVAIDGEHAENSQMYPDFAKVAKEEGLDDIAKMLENIAAIEKTHEEHFKLLLGKLGSATVVQDGWKCKNCGNIVYAKAAPTVCPVCSFADIGWSGSKAYMQITEVV